MRHLRRPPQNEPLRGNPQIRGGWAGIPIGTETEAEKSGEADFQELVGLQRDASRQVLCVRWFQAAADIWLQTVGNIINAPAWIPDTLQSLRSFTRSGMTNFPCLARTRTSATPPTLAIGEDALRLSSFPTA